MQLRELVLGDRQSPFDLMDFLIRQNSFTIFVMSLTISYIYTEEEKAKTNKKIVSENICVRRRSNVDLFMRRAEPICA